MSKMTKVMGLKCKGGGGQWAKPNSNWAQGVDDRLASGAKCGETSWECFSMHGEVYSTSLRQLQEDPWPSG
jgi:hypothetical protein